MKRVAARQSGMTLIEILVAMCILAILSVLGYKAFSALLISRERLMETSASWVDLARLFRRIETDLDALPVPDGRERTSASLRLQDDAGAQRLMLSVFSPSRPDGKDVLVYQAGAGLSWSSLRVPGERFDLLGAEYRIRWQVLLDDGRRVAVWPDGSDNEARALEMRIDGPAIGAVTRLWSLP